MKKRKRTEINDHKLLTRREALGASVGALSTLLLPSVGLTEMEQSAYVARQVTFVNVSSSKQATLRLISPFGTINVHSRQSLSGLLQEEGDDTRPVLLHPRLLLMLQRIGDRFNGKKIEVLSAHRFDKHGESGEHSAGRALDFRISRVPLEEVFNFAKTLPRCGVGYYPASNFVHLDVRDEFAMWIDYHHDGRNCAIAERSSQIIENPPGKELTFYGISADRTLKLELVSANGVVNNHSRVELSELAAYRVKNTRISLFHPRLMLMLQKVADEYPGVRFDIVSGYRIGKTKHSSPHNYGRAMDFRMHGIENKVLYDFVRTLPDCGTGYYPNSVFVHLDVRDQKTTWVDYSGVGE